MTNLVIGFLSGLVVGGGGVIALMYRDWQECKRLSKRIAERLEAMDTDEQRKTEGQ